MARGSAGKKNQQPDTGRKAGEMESVLTQNQKRTWTKVYIENGEKYRITVTARYDDKCNNGHNTFAITAHIDEQKKNNRWYCYSGGCIHDEIIKHFPELQPLIKWHLCDSTGPMHYIANTVYFAGERKLDAARSAAIWPDATDEDLIAPGLEDRLKARLPGLLKEFKTAMESLDFVF